MCLQVTVNPESKKLAHEIRGKKSIVAYKAVDLFCVGDKEEILATHYRGTAIKPGWFKSNRQARFAKVVELLPGYEDVVFKPLSRMEYQWERVGINRGIHVYLKPPYGKYHIPVTCLVKDLVAVGTFHSEESAVFTKIFVRREDYLRAIK
jgi:hypothetical protein